MRSLVGAAVAFGSATVLAKSAYRWDAEPVPLLGVRLLVAALLLTAAVRPRSLMLLRRRELAAAAAAGVAFAGAGVGEFLALARAPAPTVAVLVFLAPAWIAIYMRVAERRRLGAARALAVTALVAGLALFVSVPGGSAPDAGAVALALAASAFSAAFFLMLERLGRGRAMLGSTAVATWAAAAVVVPIDPSGAAHELGRPATAAHGLAIGALTAAALALLAAGVAAPGAALIASALICTEPLVVALLSWAVFGDVLTGAQVAGGVTIVMAVVSLSALSARSPPSPASTRRTRRRRPGSRPPPRPARSARHLR